MAHYPKTLTASFIGYSLGIALGGVGLPLIYREIIDLISSTDPAVVAPQALALVGVLAVIAISNTAAYRLGDYAHVYCQSNVMRDITNDVFERLGRHSYGFFTNNFAGSLVAKAKRLVKAYETIHDTVVFNLLDVVIKLSGMFITLFLSNLFLGFLFLGWTVIYLVLTILFVRKKMHYDLKKAEADSRVTGFLADVLTNIFTVKYFATAKDEYRTYRRITQDEHTLRLASWNFGNIQYATQSFMIFLLEAGGMYLAIKLWINGSISTGTVVLVQIYVGLIFGSLWMLSRSLTRLIEGVSDANEMTAILEKPIEISDPAHPQKLSITRGEIQFDAVSFSYAQGEAVFSDFNLTITPGEKVGLVGHSGSGKTTLTKMLLRFADIDAGSITIDGTDIRNVTQDDVHRAIAFVPQEPLLFHRSISENIAYAQPGASIDEIRTAAERAKALDFIEKLPHGFDTMVGERGIKLSGGERQRVAIARAMLKDAPIIILDEATSSLDSISETYIQDSLEELTKDKTTIVIAHRLSTIQRMDRIIVLKDGRIAETGTHSELIKKRGEYYDLWSHQQSGFIE